MCLELSDRLLGRASELFGAFSLEGSREEHLQRAEPLERFVVKFSGPAATLLIRGGDAHPQLLLLDAPRGGQGCRGAACERAHEPLVLGAEGCTRVEAVERDEDADSAAVEGERHEHRHVGSVRQIGEAESHAAGDLAQSLGMAAAQHLAERGSGGGEARSHWFVAG